MSKTTTTDPGTPIFGELHDELGMPEIEIHDFDEHAFNFLKSASAEDGAEADSAAAAEEHAESSVTEAVPAQGKHAEPGAEAEAGEPAKAGAAATQGAGSQAKAASKRGGKRRKEE